MNSAIYIDISWSIHFNKHDEGSPQMTVNCSWPWSYVNIFLMIKYLIFEILPSEKHCCCKVVLLCCPLVNFLFENFALEILWTITSKWCNDVFSFFTTIPSMGFSHSIICISISFILLLIGIVLYQHIWFQMFICKVTLQ